MICYFQIIKKNQKIALGVTRTHDLRIMRPTLYRLSYQSLHELSFNLIKLILKNFGYFFNIYRIVLLKFFCCLKKWRVFSGS